MAFDESWDESKPTATEEASLGDDRIREDRYAVRERMAVQHQAYADETDKTDVWEHTPGECTVLFVGTKTNFPTPDTTTKGCMAIATDENNKIYHWSGTEWTETGVVLTGGQAQTIAGVKTFSDIPVFSKGLSANNAYLQGRNAAGNGNVDLIKANASDVPTVKEGAVLATSAAPTTDPMIPNKKYVDTKEPILVTQATAGIFGSWTNLDSASSAFALSVIYKVGSDGFVTVYDDNTLNTIFGYTDGNSSPATIRTAAYGGSAKGGGFTMPVRKDDYWKITCTSAIDKIYWLPIGTGTCVKQP